MNLELNVVRFNNEDVIATSNEDVIATSCELTVYKLGDGEDNGAFYLLDKNGNNITKTFEGADLGKQIKSNDEFKLFPENKPTKDTVYHWNADTKKFDACLTPNDHKD